MLCINEIQSAMFVILQHDVTALSQWAAYFGRAVAKLDHTCATLSSRRSAVSFTHDVQIPPKTDGRLR
jgi:hypothetical protein